MNKKQTAILLLFILGINSLNAGFVSILWRAHVTKVTKKIERPAEFGGEDGYEIIRPTQRLIISKDGKKFSLNTGESSANDIDLNSLIRTTSDAELDEAQKQLDTTLELIRYAQEQGCIVDCYFKPLFDFQCRIKNLRTQNYREQNSGATKNDIDQFEQNYYPKLNIIDSIGLGHPSLREVNNTLKDEKMVTSLKVVGATLATLCGLPIIWKVIKKIKNRTHKPVQHAA